MIVMMMVRTSLNVGHVGSKTRALGQIKALKTTSANQVSDTGPSWPSCLCRCSCVRMALSSYQCMLCQAVSQGLKYPFYKIGIGAPDKHE